MLTRSIGWMMAAALVLAVVACDQKDTGADAGPGQRPPSSTAPGSGTSAATGGEPTDGGSVDVDAQIASARHAIEDAAGDFCATVQATAALPGVNVGTTTEAEAAAGLILSMLRHMGAVAGDDAPVYERVAERFEADFDAADHSAVWLRSPDAFQALDDPAFIEATTRLQQRATQECRTG